MDGPIHIPDDGRDCLSVLEIEHGDGQRHRGCGPRLLSEVAAVPAGVRIVGCKHH